MALLTTERLEGRDLLLTERVRAGIVLPDGVEVVVMVRGVFTAEPGDRILVAVGDNRIALPDGSSETDAALRQVLMGTVWAAYQDDDEAVRKVLAMLTEYTTGATRAGLKPLIEG